MTAKPDFTDVAILQARGDWASGRYKDDWVHEQAKGYPKGTLRRWREQRRPDGRDWNEFKALTVPEPAAIMPRTLSGSRMESLVAEIRALSDIINISVACIRGGGNAWTGPPEDPDRELAPTLYNDAGEVIPIGALYPTKYRDATDTAAQALRLRRESADQLLQIATSEELLEKALIEKIAEMADALRFTPEQREKLAAMAAKGSVATGRTETEETDEEATDDGRDAIED